MGPRALRPSGTAVRRSGRPPRESWAGMEAAGSTTTLSSFAASLSAAGEEPAAAGYLHDWPLPQECPAALQGFSVPSYFAADLLQSLPHRSVYRDQWPSLFVGRHGSQSGVHQDNLGSHAWMLHLSGRKKWRIVRHSQAALLYPASSHASYAADLFNTDFTAHPAARMADVYEVEALPGDLIFVPAGALHQVVNVDTTVAVTMNWIDASCVELALKAIRARGVFDESVDDLGDLMERAHSAGSVPAEPSQRHLPWAEFKRQGGLSVPPVPKEAVGYLPALLVIVILVGFVTATRLVLRDAPTA
eukprot:TRINITY_DN26567_c0_g1_i2.p2 TRINITY_DN26567_c0_g1~~TRINITY_DN26567_c0_g1_i2.p2  ORF type:complete len:303 (+),score=86.44 TRINITY_DN26567_c0_g1_i2:471-1379(+)